MTRRRIVIHNEFARTLDIREGIKKVPAHALKRGDVLGGNGEKVVQVSRGATTPQGKVEVILEKDGYRRQVFWGTHTMVGVASRSESNDGGPGSGPHPNHQVFYEKGDPRKPASESERRMLGGRPPSKTPPVKIDPEKLKRAQEQAEATRRLMGHDGVGSPEEIAYGEGWHSTTRENPYISPAERAAWEKGRKARAQKSKMTNAYFKGEVRGKSFQQPRPRDAELRLWRYDKITGYWKVERTVSPETASQWLAIFQKDQPGETFKVSTSRPNSVPEQPRSHDYKSEKGYVAKLLDAKTGAVLAKSEPYISNGAGLKLWVQQKANELIRSGKRVKAEIVTVFFDPNLAYDHG